MFKTSHVGVSKFGFLLLCLFHAENLNGMPILPLKTASFWKWYSYGVRDKIGIAKNFLYGKGPFHTENPNGMPILSLKTTSFWKRCSYRVNGKIGIAKNFLYGMGKVRENQSLIHLSEKF
jgi:hypothetical protein